MKMPFWVYLIENLGCLAAMAACFCCCDGAWKLLGLIFLWAMNIPGSRRA